MTPERRVKIYAEALQRGAEARKKMAAAEGGSLSPEEAARLLGAAVVDVEGRVAAHRLVAWTDDQGRHRFPRWQFYDDGLLPGLEQVLQVLPYQDEWAVMWFFLCQRLSLDSKRPLDLLRSGDLQTTLMHAKSEDH